MCGIVGYIGSKDSTDILLNALKRLEYRGYDSCGLGVIADKDKKIYLKKTQGKIRNLSDLLRKKPLPLATLGISHTRWATHGRPSRINAHPHADSQSGALVVHNGIIENYQTLKKELQDRGCCFVSQTDSEVIAHLVASFDQGDILKAVQRTVKKLQGSFALGVLSSSCPDRIIAVRKGSPLIIGAGDKEYFIASDAPAILDQTRKIIYLNDGEVAELTRQGVRIFDANGKLVKPRIQTVTMQATTAEKEGFAHFMLKEIHQQPKVLDSMVSTRLKQQKVVLEGLALTNNAIKKIDQVFIVGCGTAYHAGLVGKYLIEQLAGIPVSIDVSSEFRYRTPIIGRGTLVVAISQSGETADTLAAVREAKSRGAYIVSVCNVVGSSLARESNGVLYTHAGPEIGVASTKAYTAQLCMMYLLGIKLSSVKKGSMPVYIKNLIRDLKKIPFLMSLVLKDKAQIKRISKANSHFGCFLFLGRNINFPSALEGALKLKEISYIPAEGYAAGEMKHGPIALIDEYRAVVCVSPQADTYDKMISNMQEIRARRGKIIAVATHNDDNIPEHADHVIYIPATNKLLTPLLVALPLQLIAYYIALERGSDVDQPRNLAKSVTVE